MPRIGTTIEQKENPFTEEHLKRFESAINKAGSFMKLMVKVKAITVYEGGVRAIKPLSINWYWKRHVEPTIGKIEVGHCPGPIPYQFWKNLEDAHAEWMNGQNRRANAALDKNDNV